MGYKNTIIKNFEESITLKQKLLENKEIIKKVENVVELFIQCFNKNGKVLFCGNGGSAADAQHLAAEFSGRYYIDRPPLFAEALHVNTSYLTAVANDYNFDCVYTRMLEAMGTEGDILFCLSTSGNSKNVIDAAKKAQSKKMTTICLTGESGGDLKNYCDILINIPSTNTPRIQECHMIIGHSICELVESTLFGK